MASLLLQGDPGWARHWTVQALQEVDKRDPRSLHMEHGELRICVRQQVTRIRLCGHELFTDRLHDGLVSSHLIRLLLHVKHPVLTLVAQFL